MVNLNVMLSIPMSFKCAQCLKELHVKPDKRNPGAAVLECLECGVKILAVQGAPARAFDRSGRGIPEFRPQPKT